MVKIREKNNAVLYQCEACGLTYKEREIAQKCQAWCKEHKSCNLDIIQHALSTIAETYTQKS